MRPDTRSFSFTWLRGQQHQEELSLGRASTKGQTASSWHNPNYENLDSSANSSPDQIEAKTPRCTGSRYGLRRFGNSFLQNITNTNDTKYDTMEHDGDDVHGTEDEHAPEIRNDQLDSIPTTSKSTLSIGKRLNKTVQDVKSSIGNFSQRFRRSTRRRYRMEDGSPATPISPTRRILGRTPTKLYSPFGFDSPSQKTPKRLATDRPLTPRLPNGNMTRTYSPGNNLKKGVKDIRRGFMTRDVTRKSVRF